MILEIPSSPKLKSYIFEGQLAGIRCISCKNKIINNLKGYLSIQNVEIDVIAERCMLTIANREDVTNIQLKIKEIGFDVLGDFQEIILSNSSDTRTIFFSTNLSLHDQLDLASKLQEALPAVLKSEFSNSVLAVEYNPRASRASKIREYLKQEYGESIQENDQFLQSFQKRKSNYESSNKLLVSGAIGTIIFFFIISTIFPQFDIFEDVALFPKSMGVISFYVIAMLIVSIIIILIFGKQIIVSAFNNFYHHKILNMETLISIGSLSSIIMVLFMLVICIYEDNISQENGQIDSNSQHSDHDLDTEITLDSMNHDNEHKLDMIQEIIHMMETACLILAIITLGKYQESKAKKSILDAADSLFPKDFLLQNQLVEKIEISNKKFDISSTQSLGVSYIDKDDFILLKAPFRLLHDVTVLHNLPISNLKVTDQIMYGSNEPFFATNGQVIRSGAVILEGSAIAQVNQPIEKSLLFSTWQQLDLAKSNSESTQSGMSALLGRISSVFVKSIITISFITLFIWLFIIATDFYQIDQTCKWCYPFERFISVLVASCPCALGLAIPSVIANSLNLAMKNSILIKKNSVFEKVSKIKAVIFDKTGTLFTRVAKIEDFKNLKNNEYSEDSLWSIIQLLERGICHPIAEALYQESIKKMNNYSIDFDFKLQNNSKISRANGVEATIVNCTNSQPLKVVIGNQMMLKSLGVELNLEIQQNIEKIHKKGISVILLAIDNQLSAIIQLHNNNNLRPEAKEVVQYLTKQLKKEVFILSGDNKDTVLEVGRYLGIPESNLIGDCEAFKKQQLIRKLKVEQKKEVMMIGDGLNDILSLEEACLGVSINAKSELNLLASDVVVLKEDLWNIVYIFNLVKVSKIFIYINLFWAFSYNFFMIPLAAGCFCTLGLKVSPLFSTSAMSLSSILVVFFSSMINCKKLKVQKDGQRKEFQKVSLSETIEIGSQTLRHTDNQVEISIEIQ